MGGKQEELAELWKEMLDSPSLRELLAYKRAWKIVRQDPHPRLLAEFHNFMDTMFKQEMADE